MLLFAVLISISFTLGNMAANTIEPAALTAVRFFIAAMLIGVTALPLMKPVHFKHFWRYLVIGGLLAGYFILMFEALRITDPVSTSALFTLTPMMSAIFGYLLLRQITTPVTILSLVLAGCGAIWVIFRADVEAILSLRFGAGERLFLIGCAMHALYTPAGRLLNRGEPVLVYSFASICGGLLVTGIYGANAIASTQWLALSAITWSTALYLGIFTTAGTVFLLQYAAMRLSSAKVMAYGYLVPVFVIAWEGLLGNGWIALNVLPGIIAIVFALAVIRFQR